MSLSLFERLMPHLAEPGQQRDGQQVSELAESVRRHLTRLFNTHDETAAACTEYGLPDLKYDLQVLDARKQKSLFEEVVAERIADFEPRLTDVSVRCTHLRSERAEPSAEARGEAARAMKNPFIASFRITGSLVERTRVGFLVRGNIELQTRFKDEGTVVIERTRVGTGPSREAPASAQSPRRGRR